MISEIRKISVLMVQVQVLLVIWYSHKSFFHQLRELPKLSICMQALGNNKGRVVWRTPQSAAKLERRYLIVGQPLACYCLTLICACHLNYHLHEMYHDSTLQVYQQVLNDQGRSLLDSLVASVTAEKAAAENIVCDQDFENICLRINGVSILTLLAIVFHSPSSRIKLIKIKLIRLNNYWQIL